MLIFNITILLIFLVMYILSRNYGEEITRGLDRKQYKLWQLYPLALYFLNKVLNNRFFSGKSNRPDKLDDTLKALYVGEDLNSVKKLYLCNKVALVLLIVFLSNLLAIGCSLTTASDGRLVKGRFIRRPGYSEGTRRISLKVSVSEHAATVLEEDMELEIGEKRYTNQELEDNFAYAKQYIDSRLLNGNESIDKILSDLMFVRRIPGSGLTVKWKSDSPKLIDEEGRVHNEELTEGVLTSVTAVITYYDRKEEYIRFIRILPREYSQEELVRRELTEAVDNLAAQSRNKDMMELPDSLGNQSITWAEKKDNSASFILLLGCLAAGVLYMLMDKELSSKVEKRNREMLIDYPEIINKFTLLVGAGMSLSNAWCKISQDYKETRNKKRYAYEEMTITYNELTIGTSEIIAYERFGRRVKLLPYLRFSSLIAQNVRKGSAGLLGLLELEAAEAFEERKELAKRMGEEAGTKLLLPMMIMLLIVLAVIMVPAFMSFGI